MTWVLHFESDVTGERLLLVRHGGVETTAAVPEEVADHLISVLGKFRTKLRIKKA